METQRDLPPSWVGLPLRRHVPSARNSQLNFVIVLRSARPWSHKVRTLSAAADLMIAFPMMNHAESLRMNYQFFIACKRGPDEAAVHLSLSMARAERCSRSTEPIPHRNRFPKS